VPGCRQGRGSIRRSGAVVGFGHLGREDSRASKDVVAFRGPCVRGRGWGQLDGELH
jgi:hypothetical protein